MADPEATVSHGHAHPSESARGESGSPPQVAGRVAVSGGTGALGYGLALRLASAGVSVAVGSRLTDRACDAAGRILTRLGEVEVIGLENCEAARDSEIVVLAVPFRSQIETLRELAGDLRRGQVVVDATVPLAAVISGRPTRVLGVPQGSAAQQAAEIVPVGVDVVAFHTVSADRLGELEEPHDENVFVADDSTAAKRRVASLIGRNRGLDRGQRWPSRRVEIHRRPYAAADRDQRALQRPGGDLRGPVAGGALVRAVYSRAVALRHTRKASESAVHRALPPHGSASDRATMTNARTV